MPEKRPAIIVIQEWWGLNEDIKEIADRYASQGYLALAPDVLAGGLTGNADRDRRSNPLSYDGERDHFFQPHPRCHVVLTMRSEHLNDCAGYLELPDAINEAAYLVRRLDERELGDTIRRRYDFQAKAGDPDQAYLDALLSELKPFTHKPFPYRAYVVGSRGMPNAMALPAASTTLSWILR